MTVQRLRGAPRLIDWTGERCVPWVDDPPIIYEHFHRYLFASRLVAGRRVLDLACGEGFGSAMLAEQAESVLGIDVDARSIEHARRNYVGPSIGFQVGDARDLSALEAGSFGAVVAFEMIEHLAEQDAVVDGIHRVLAPDGIAVLSTPERTVYSEQVDFRNPYHVRELTLPEFVELLRSRFAHVGTWGQLTITGSYLQILDDVDGLLRGERFIVQQQQEEWRVVSDMSPKYIIAVASNVAVPRAPELSVLADPGQSLLKPALKRAGASEARAEAADARLLAVEDELADERRYTAELQARMADVEGVVIRLHAELAAVQAEKDSYLWQLFQRLRGRLYRALGGRESRVGRLVERSIRLLTRGALRKLG